MKRHCVVGFVLLSVRAFGGPDGDRSDPTHAWAVHDCNRPNPPVVAVPTGAPPGDATVLFDGSAESIAKNWRGGDGKPSKWTVRDGSFVCTPGSGSAYTAERFSDCQIHLEWKTPLNDGDGWGNSGVIIMGCYEIQILDSSAIPDTTSPWKLANYADAQAASVYGQNPPIVNVCRKPGEWQSYDIVFHPVLREGERLVDPGSVTVFHNGVLVQDAWPFQGATDCGVRTQHPGKSEGPLVLQDHGHPVEFRNVWIRRIPSRFADTIGGGPGVKRADVAKKRHELAVRSRELAAKADNAADRLVRLWESFTYEPNREVKALIPVAEKELIESLDYYEDWMSAPYRKSQLEHFVEMLVRGKWIAPDGILERKLAAWKPSPSMPRREKVSSPVVKREVKPAAIAPFKAMRGKTHELKLAPDPTLVTADIQSAIDAVSAAGGGTVTIPAGRYRTGSVFLKDNVTLQLDEGATLVASTNVADYVAMSVVAPADYDAKREPWTGEAKWNLPENLRAVVCAGWAKNVALTGKGEIISNGAHVHKFMRSGPKRCRTVIFFRCGNVRVEDLTMRESAYWTCYFKECDGVVARRLRIDAQATWENDGIDIDSKNVLVEDCQVDSMDDGICLKSDNPNYVVENVEVRNCRVSSSCNFIKFGTSCYGGFRNVRIHDCKLVPGRTNGHYRHHQYVTKHGKIPGVTDPITGCGGISLQATDGGPITDVHVWNIDMTERCVQTPIFLRLQRRHQHPSGKPGRLENVLIENVKGVSASYVASSLTGVPGLRIRNVTLRNLDFTLKGGGTLADSSKPVPECETGYPQSTMFEYHMLPGYAFYLRHADGIRFENVRVNYAPAAEERPPVVQDDCTDVTFADCTFQPPVGVQKDADKDGFVWYDAKELAAKGLLEGKAFADVTRFLDRLPSDSEDGRVGAGVKNVRFHTTGECFRFKSSTSRIKVRWSLVSPTVYMHHMPPTGVAGIDFYVWEEGRGWRYRQWRHEGGRGITVADNRTTVSVTPNQPVMLYLPLYNGPSSFEIGLEKGSTLAALPPRKSGITQPVVFYGTSITHGGCPSRPGMSFTSIVCRRLDAPQVNLGFSGWGTMEDGMLDYVSRIDASCYVLDCLANMNDELVIKRFEPFVRALRQRRPNVPIVCAQQPDVYGSGRFKVKDDHVAAVIEKLRKEGLKDLYLVGSKDMYDPDGEGTVDGTHPNDWGMKCLADAYGRVIGEALKKRQGGF